MNRFARCLLPAALLGLLLPASALAEGDAEAGKKQYDMFCFTCHGSTGKGDGPAGAMLDPKPRDFSVGDYKLDADKDGTPGTDADLALVITKGASAFGGSAVMTPWSPPLTEQQVNDIVAYLRALKK